MTQQGEVQQTQQTQQARRRLGGGAIASLIGLAVLVIFVIQNRARIKIDFLFWTFIWPLWLYTIVIAVFGALVWVRAGRDTPPQAPQGTPRRPAGLTVHTRAAQATAGSTRCHRPARRAQLSSSGLG